MSEAAHIPQLRFPEYSANWSQRLLSDFLIPTLREIEKPKVNYLAIGLRSHCKGTFQKPDSDPSKIAMEKLFRVKENDLIVNITFAWEGAIAIVKENDEGGLVSHRFPTYTFDTNITSHHFFKHQFINKRFRYLLDLISPGGAGRNRVMSKKEFVKLKVPLPSVGEQQKIAAFLTAVDNKIEQLSKKQELLGEYKKGLMQQIFSQVIRFKADDGSDFPDWEEKKLGGIGHTFNGLTGKTKDDFGRGKPYIQYMQIFESSKINIDNFGLVDVRDDENQKVAQYGDVFFTTSSETPDAVGYSSVLLDDIDKLYLNSFCFGFRPNSLDELSPNFAQFLLRSANFRRRVVRLAQGSTRYNMSKVQLMKEVISLPCLKEQTKIANFLSSIDTKIEQVGKQLDESKQFKKALLQKMFV